MKIPFDYVREVSFGQDEIFMDGFMLDQDLKDIYLNNIKNQVFRWQLNQRQLVKHLNILLLEESKIRDEARRRSNLLSMLV